MSDYRILTGRNPDDYPSRKVAVAMSGGVDSSLAAVLLKEAGFEVVGLTMHLWDYESSGECDNNRGCCDLSTIEDAKRVAAAAGIPHYTVDVREDFQDLVVDNFVNTYVSGRTPNPCVRCNTLMKWHVLLDKARAIGCDLIATGHYARIVQHESGNYSLLEGIDNSKDQSYFLWGLASDALASTLFPLGTITKDNTRSEAIARNIKTANRTESQEICFIPDNNYGRFLRFALKDNQPKSLSEGIILNMGGNAVGKHHGAAYYTVGQRKGLGVAFGHPMYVTAVDTDNNTVTIGDTDDLLSQSMRVTEMIWPNGKVPEDTFTCKVRIRYRHSGCMADVSVKGDICNVQFTEPQRAVAPGQSAVFYNNGLVIGGGLIEKSFPV